MTLTDRHRLATSSSQPPAQPTTEPESDVFGLLGMAAMGIH